jgi:hypothetical protein
MVFGSTKEQHHGKEQGEVANIPPQLSDLHCCK